MHDQNNRKFWNKDFGQPNVKGVEYKVVLNLCNYLSFYKNIYFWSLRLIRSASIPIANNCIEPANITVAVTPKA